MSGFDLIVAALVVCGGVAGWRHGSDLRRAHDRPVPRGGRRAGARRRGRAEAAAGSAATLVLVVLAGAALGQVGALRPALDDSLVVGAVFASHPPVVSPPAPASADDRQRPQALDIRAEPAVRGAAGSVVKLYSQACGDVKAGTGWIAGGGVVVTNAHVVSGGRSIGAQVRGAGPVHGAIPIWFDRDADLALLRVPAFKRRTGLRLSTRSVKRGTAVGILGFPLAGPFLALRGRVASTIDTVGGERVSDSRSSRVMEGRLLRVQSLARPGNSGSPVVARDGRVLATVFATQGLLALAVPAATIAPALARARAPVSSGGCE